MRDLVILIMIGVVTFLLRGAFLFAPDFSPPATLRRLLPQVGPAVLAAIALPALLGTHGDISLPTATAGLTGALLAGLLWWRAGSIPLALFGGLGAWWLVAVLLSG
jgi:branched-subunit amino acid transport protein